MVLVTTASSRVTTTTVRKKKLPVQTSRTWPPPTISHARRHRGVTTNAANTPKVNKNHFQESLKVDVGDRNDNKNTIKIRGEIKSRDDAFSHLLIEESNFYFIVTSERQNQEGWNNALVPTIRPDWIFCFCSARHKGAIDSSPQTLTLSEVEWVVVD